MSETLTDPAAAKPEGSNATRRDRSTNGSRTQDLALIGVFAALMAVLHFTPPITLSFGVPITLGTLGVGLAGLVLGPWRGLASMSLYVALGLVGLPIFSGFSGGLGVLAGPSAGYILSWPLGAFLTGLAARAIVRRANMRAWIPLFFVAGFVAGLLSFRLLGIPGMALNMDVSLLEAFYMDLAFWPGDALKALAAAVIAALVHRAFPSILVRR